MKRPARLTKRMIDDIAARLSEGKRVRRNMPRWGRLHVDRKLPFLCVYRRQHEADAGTGALITGEASYLLAPGGRTHREGVLDLTRAAVSALSAEFGGFLILEIWEGPPPEENSRRVARADIKIHVSRTRRPEAAVDALQAALDRARIFKRKPNVEIVEDRSVHPKGRSPLLPAAVARSLDCHIVGIEISPVYRNPQTGDLYPSVHRAVKRALGRALRRCAFEFSQRETQFHPEHYHMMGRRAVVKAVWDVDRRLAEVSGAFDYLLALTPVNSHGAWLQFRRASYDRTPTFHYRPAGFDPALLKRQLFQIPIERIEDPSLANLFREKQDELARQITMIDDRETRRFLPGSLQVFGSVDEELADTAETILSRVAPRSRGDGGKSLTPEECAARAREAIAEYRAAHPGFKAKARVREDIPPGMLVSRGSLLIGARSRISESRMASLVHHEVGTHLLTYYNGRAQPFRQLYSGLAGYEELQEGLAVLGEYLAGGLNRSRLRLLAARVVAVKSLVDGASFVETFRVLHRGHGMDRRAAYNVTMRVHRSGGLTKDSIYLRGLRGLLEHMAAEPDLDLLYVGKIGLRHVPVIEELMLRGVLKPAPLRPAYLDLPEAGARLEKLRRGIGLLDLLEGKRKRS